MHPNSLFSDHQMTGVNLFRFHRNNFPGRYLILMIQTALIAVEQARTKNTKSIWMKSFSRYTKIDNLSMPYLSLCYCL